MPEKFDVSFPHRVLFGVNSVRDLGDTLSSSGYSHSVVLMDAGIKNSGIGLEIVELLKQFGINVSIVDDLAREPADDDVDRVLALVKSYNPDNIVAVGGGSVLDVGKICSVLTHSDTKILELLDGAEVPTHSIFTTLIPTTSGTGAEATKNAIIAIPSRATKKAVVHARLLPDLVVLDPQLTLKMPSMISATTGMDALCHAMECYLSKKANQMSDMLAIEAVKRIATSLRKVVTDGEDIVARSNMLLASYYAGTCITLSGTNAVHALSYPLGIYYNLPHGHSNAILLPYVMEKNLPALPEKCKALALAFGYDSNENDQSPAVYLVEELFQLLQDLNIQSSLSEIELKPNELQNLVDIAHGNRRLMDNNPVDLTAQEIEQIYLRLFEEHQR